MKIGEIIELDITSSGMDGEGVGRLDGVVVFVPQAMVGEKVKASITQVKKSFITAKVIKVLEPSADRVKPLCPKFFQCGGCEMQHIRYEKQLEIKRANIINLFNKNHIDCEVQEVVPCEKQYGYRNKAQIPIRKEKDKLLVGYYRKGSHSIVEFCGGDEANALEQTGLGRCPLHSRHMQEFVDCIADFIEKENISCYDEVSGKGIVRHICIRQIEENFACVLVINSSSLPKADVLVKKLKYLGYGFSLSININTKRTNVIFGDKTKTIFGEERLKGSTLGVEFKVSPTSFLQVNDEMRDKLYSYVNSLIDEGGCVIDCFSGIGILSNVLAKKADKVIAIEILKEAVADAKELAKDNGNSKKIENYCDDASNILPKVVKKNPNAIFVVDPPRKGLSESVINTLIEAEPSKIVYISCEPSTLARDISLLSNKYDILSIKPFDMFPQCSGVETVAELVLKK